MGQIYKNIKKDVYFCRKEAEVALLLLQIVGVGGPCARDSNTTAAVKHHHMCLHRLVLGVNETICAMSEACHSVSIDGAEAIFLRRRTTYGAILCHIHIENPSHRTITIWPF